MTEIKSGNTEITGDFTDSEARYLADIFNSGGSGLPVRLRVAEEKMAMK
jgi:preprotein translocase subunit SecD